MKKLIILILSAIILFSGCADSEADYSKEFEGLNGCAVFYSTSDNKYVYYNKAMCNTEFSPYSTFKIISAATALENNIISSPYDKMKYNGNIYPFEAWNRDLTLKEAFQSSCVWYFRQLTDKIGEENMQKAVDELNYGNRDISQWQGSGDREPEDLNGFWLGSTLKISPKEQVDVMRNIFDGNTFVSEKTISILKDIMLCEDENNIKIYGKTGTGNNNQAWYAGFSEICGYTTYFAVYIEDENTDNVVGANAKEIAIKILNEYYLK